MLTGIHLMRTVVAEGNLVRLAEEARLAHVTDLIARKLAGPERSVLDDSDLGFHQREYERLRGPLGDYGRKVYIAGVVGPRGTCVLN